MKKAVAENMPERTLTVKLHGLTAMASFNAGSRSLPWSGIPPEGHSSTPSRVWPSGCGVNRRVHILAILAISVMIFLAYSSALGNDFIWDDEFLIRDNTAISSFSNTAKIFRTYLAATSGNINNFYRPIQELSYMTDVFLWGRHPFGFHLTNIILHVLCAIFLYLLSLKIFNNWLAAFVTACLFGIHPINTEAVTYIAGRADSLYLLFFLISFTLFLRVAGAAEAGLRTPYVLYALSALFYALSIISKEIGLILPLFFILYIVAFRSRPERKKLYPLLVPYAIILLAYVIMRKTVLDFSGISPSFIMAKFSLCIRMLTTSKVICVYLFLLAAPFGLHMERRIKVADSIFSPEVILSLAVILSIAAAIYIFSKKSRMAFFAGLWFFIGLIPVSNIVPINSFIAEHWLYLPAIGVYMLVGLACARFFYGPPGGRSSGASRRVVVSALTCMFIFFGVVTFERNKDWKDGVTFFKNALKYSPNNAKLHLNFGNVYYYIGRRDDAMREYNRTIELQPASPGAYSNIANVYLSQGNYKMAGEYAKKALSIKSDLPAALEIMRRLKAREGG
jgi:tetratricopeptide (TPR) repeat protein